MTVLSGQEGVTETLFRNAGTLDAWYPHRWWRDPPRKAKPGQKRDRKRTKIADPSGYVFIHVDCTPQWHILKDRRFVRTPIDVLKVGGVPRIVTEAEIAHMEQQPERVKELADKIKAEQIAARQAKQPHVGGRAKIVEGAFAGKVGVVDRISDGSVIMTVERTVVATALDWVERVG
jgi:transcription antitermination factor NusG